MTEASPRSRRRRVRPRHVVVVVLALMAAIGLWRYWSGSPRMTLPVGELAYAVAFSPDGSTLATGGSQSVGVEPTAIIRLWDVASGRMLASWATNGDHVTHLAFSPDGRTLTSTARVQYHPVDHPVPKCELRDWDLATLEAIGDPRESVYPPPFPVVSADGRLAASHGEPGVVVVTDALTGQELYRAEVDRSQVNCAAFSSAGDLLVTGGGDTAAGGPSPVPWMNGEVRLREAAGGRLLATYSRHWRPIMGVAFSPDGKLVASAGLDGTVKVWAVPGR